MNKKVHICIFHNTWYGCAFSFLLLGLFAAFQMKFLGVCIASIYKSASRLFFDPPLQHWNEKLSHLLQKNIVCVWQFSKSSSFCTRRILFKTPFYAPPIKKLCRLLYVCGKFSTSFICGNAPVAC